MPVSGAANMTRQQTLGVLGINVSSSPPPEKILQGKARKLLSIFDRMRGILENYSIIFYLDGMKWTP